MWNLAWDKGAAKDFKKLGSPDQKRILSKFEKEVLPAQDPTAFAKRLHHGLSHLWRFRFGEQRVITSIDPKTRTITVEDISNRDKVYSSANGGRDTTLDWLRKVDGIYVGLLQLSNGDQYDVYGETLKEFKDEGIAIAKTLGEKIDIFNLEAPE